MLKFGGSGIHETIDRFARMLALCPRLKPAYARFSGADNSERPFNHSAETPLSRPPPNASRPTPSFSRRESRLPPTAGLLHSDGFEPVSGRDQHPCTDGKCSRRRLRTFPNLHSPHGPYALKIKALDSFLCERFAALGFLEFRTLSGPALGSFLRH